MEEREKNSIKSMEYFKASRDQWAQVCNLSWSF